MQLFQRTANAMDHRCGEVDRHLPTLVSKDLSLMCNGFEHLTLTDTKGSASFGFVPHLRLTGLASALTCLFTDLFNEPVNMGDFQHACRQIKRWNHDKAMEPRSLPHCVCLPLLYDFTSAPILRGMVIVNPTILRISKGILLWKQRSRSKVVLPPQSTRHLSSVTVLALSFHSPATAANWLYLVYAMPRLRHRLRNRHGGTRGRPTRDHSSSSSVSASLSSGFFSWPLSPHTQWKGALS